MRLPRLLATPATPPLHSGHESPLAGPTGGPLVGAYRLTAPADRSVHTTTSHSGAGQHRTARWWRYTDTDTYVWPDVHKGNIDPYSAWLGPANEWGCLGPAIMSKMEEDCGVTAPSPPPMPVFTPAAQVGGLEDDACATKKYATL